MREGGRGLPPPFSLHPPLAAGAQLKVGELTTRIEVSCKPFQEGSVTSVLAGLDKEPSRRAPSEREEKKNGGDDGGRPRPTLSPLLSFLPLFTEGGMERGGLKARIYVRGGQGGIRG